MSTLSRLIYLAMPFVATPVLAVHAGLAVHPGIAHDGPAHRVAQLTKKMVKSGRTAELLFQRSVCFLALKKRERALLDLDAAVALDGKHEKAVVERVRVLGSLGRCAAAIAAADRGKAAVQTPALRFRLAKTITDIHIEQQKYRAALVAIRAAETALPHRPEMMLRRSVVRGLLDQTRRRLRELEARLPQDATAAHPILLEEYCDALIATGDARRAESFATARLAQCRFHSRWLVRRARARLSQGDRAAAESDLMAALRELSRRIHPNAPDLLLLADRAETFHLLGHREASHTDVRRLRAKGYPHLLMLRLALKLNMKVSYLVSGTETDILRMSVSVPDTK